jgi:predicted MFS family arabinose efflux permease
MTLITGAPTEEQRGKFLVIRSSLIELSEGAAAIIGGMIITQNATTQRLENYNIVGYVAVGIGILCIYLAQRIENKRRIICCNLVLLSKLHAVL